MYSFEYMSYPKNGAFFHLGSSLPSLCLGSLVLSLYQQSSPKHTNLLSKGLPRTLCHAVRPSAPLTLTVSSSATCSIILAIIGCRVGILQRIAFSRAAL